MQYLSQPRCSFRAPLLKRATKACNGYKSDAHGRPSHTAALHMPARLQVAHCFGSVFLAVLSSAEFHSEAAAATKEAQGNLTSQWKKFTDVLRTGSHAQYERAIRCIALTAGCC